jgi:hypothetical protein
VVLQQVVLLQQLHRLAHHIAAAAGARGRAAGLDAHHAVIALGHEILGPQFLGVEIDLLQDVDHRGLQVPGQREGRIVLRVAADLQHLLAQFGKRRRQVRGGGRFADPALAVDREHLGALDLHRRVLMDLERAFAVLAFQDRGAPMPRAARPAASRIAARAAGGSFVQHRRSSPIRRPRRGPQCPSSRVLQFVRASLKRGERRLVGVPVVAVERFQQAVRHPGGGLRVQLRHPAAHLGVQHEGLGKPLIDPGLHLPGRRRPAQVLVTCASIWRTPSWPCFSSPSNHFGFRLRERVSSAT